MPGTKRLAAALAALYFIGAATYGMVVPVFEGPDESAHFAFIQYMAVNWHIPDVVNEYGDYTAQGTHGPLYYFISALAIQPFDLSDTSALPLANPQGSANDIDGLSNKNGHIHTPLEAWPYRAGIIRAIHVARLISASFGTLAVISTVFIAARFSFRVALLAGLFVATLPSFLFLGGLMNNDVPGAALAACSLWMLLRYWEQPGIRPALVAGAFIGLAILAKAGGVWLLPLAALVVLFRRHGAWRMMFTEGLLILLACLLLSGWWMGLNIARYGDPTGLSGSIALMPGEQLDYTDPATLYEMVRRTTFAFWAVFGATTIAAPAWIYITLNLLGLVVLAGIALTPYWHTHRATLLICLGWGALLTAAGIAWEMRVASWHGRHFFAAISAYGVLAALGIDGWQRYQPAGRAAYAFPVGIVLLAVLAPPLVIRPAYAPPPIVETLLPDVEPICVQFGSLRLLGVAAGGEVAPGEILETTFYWQSDRTLTYDEFLFIRLLDGNLMPIAGDNTYHGGGNWPTKLWTPGVIYADQVRLRVDPDAPAPTLARLTVQVDHYGEDVPVTCNGVPGDPLSPLASVRVVKPQSPPPERMLLLGDEISLVTAAWPDTARPGEMVAIDLTWYVETAPERNLTRFVHLEQGKVLVAGNDGLPAGFPALVWQPGDLLPDRITLTLPRDAPAGTYVLRVGMYDDAGVRLSNIAPDDRAPIGVIEVIP